jgi:hypothetical protein
MVGSGETPPSHAVSGLGVSPFVVGAVVLPASVFDAAAEEEPVLVELHDADAPNRPATAAVSSAGVTRDLISSLAGMTETIL